MPLASVQDSKQAQISINRVSSVSSCRNKAASDEREKLLLATVASLFIIIRFEA